MSGPRSAPPAAAIFRQLLTESLVLAAIGGAGGLLVAAWVLPTVLALSPGSVREVHASISWPVAIFALIASVATGLLFGCVPATAERAAKPGRRAAGRRVERLEDGRAAGSGESS